MSDGAYRALSIKRVIKGFFEVKCLRYPYTKVEEHVGAYYFKLELLLLPVFDKWCKFLALISCILYRHM